MKKAAQLQDVSKAVAFLQENGIKTMAQLSDKLSASKSELLSLKSDLTPKQKRAKEPKALLGNYEDYKNFKAVYAEYEGITKNGRKMIFMNAIAEKLHFLSVRKILSNLCFPTVRRLRQRLGNLGLTS